MHCSFSGLFVCFARVSRTVCSLDCLFAMQESRALFVLWIVCLLPKSLVLCLFSGLLSKSLEHCLFSGLFFSFARFFSTVCSLDGSFVTRESRARSVLWIVCLLLRVSCTVCSLDCYPRVSCTVCSLDCLFVTRESRALSVLWIVCLQCKSLVHYFFSGLFVCYARVSCTVFSPGFFIIFTHKSLF